MTSQGRQGEKVAHQNYNSYWNRKSASSRMGRASVLPRALSISLSRNPGPHFFLTGPVPGYLPLHERTLQQLQSLGSWGVCMWRAALGAPSRPLSIYTWIPLSPFSRATSNPIHFVLVQDFILYCWIIFQTCKINVFAKSVTITQAWNSILRTFRTFEYRLSFRWSPQVMKSKPRRAKHWGEGSGHHLSPAPAWSRMRGT